MVSAIKTGSCLALLAALPLLAGSVRIYQTNSAGDDLDVIGSGPTVPDPSTFAEARAIVEKYRLWNKLPAAVRDRTACVAARRDAPARMDRVPSPEPQRERRHRPGVKTCA